MQRARRPERSNSNPYRRDVYKRQPQRLQARKGLQVAASEREDFFMEKRAYPKFTITAGGFAETPEGKALYAQCLKDGDMAPYKATKAAYAEACREMLPPPVGVLSLIHISWCPVLAIGRWSSVLER